MGLQLIFVARPKNLAKKPYRQKLVSTQLNSKFGLPQPLAP